MPHPDVDAEQAYLDDAYRCLSAMRVRTARAASIAEGAAQAVDSAIAQQHLAHRFGSLEVDVPGLSFGRLDGDDGARWYVGRRHVEDDRGEPVVVDWRADVAVPFYRATAVDPLGLRRRRRFIMTRPPPRRPVRRGVRRSRQRRRRSSRRHPRSAAGGAGARAHGRDA